MFFATLQHTKTGEIFQVFGFEDEEDLEDFVTRHVMAGHSVTTWRGAKIATYNVKAIDRGLND